MNKRKIIDFSRFIFPCLEDGAGRNKEHTRQYNDKILNPEFSEHFSLLVKHIYKMSLNVKVYT